MIRSVFQDFAPGGFLLVRVDRLSGPNPHTVTLSPQPPDPKL